MRKSNRHSPSTRRPHSQSHTATRLNASHHLPILALDPEAHTHTQTGTQVMLPRPLFVARRAMSQLSELTQVGKLTNKQPSTMTYSPGQFFLHSSLGYRGVVVMPFESILHNYPPSSWPDEEKKKLLTPVEASRPSKSTFYQVLTDAEDSRQHKRIGLGTQTWTPHQGVVQSLDLVSHDEIMPYIPTRQPGSSAEHVLDNPLFDTLFAVKPLSERNSSGGSSAGADAGAGAAGVDSSMVSAVPTAGHERWLKMMTPSFANRRSYSCTTHDVQVTILPFFDAMRPHDNSNSASSHKAYSWYYKAIIQYFGSGAVQLMSKWWQAIDAKGHRDFFRGRGILRQFPVLTPEEPTFQFTGHVSLATDRGLMGGSFTFVPVVGPSDPRPAPLLVDVPTFELERDDTTDSTLTQQY
ncbi:hypothetical protein PTSG_10662 [Salpingoeca rosetta]|uniref:ApaG domain-containing protein n=1 Tax=Salpingoeca rosetta (strain ATCC 50818 / BSB-021) TaxID=946362 RepID=F2UQ09_SALR5|nr:uncharacterized protein PTSG_10662 [Salpingoeca rosetta]EGD79677.1 hypothetical protein PTSG_10662 [Salpingoeca rosetta]|eukprot:XP_004988627.1 hypothetical protein PTSG_10662 [Salpingoeca rosetta]